MPHLHLSLQAGSDMVLKRMKRRHLRASALAVCRRARELRPGLALGADLIAGFPTEDEAMFAETRRFRRRGAARLSPRLSLQRAARHAGCAHAASAAATWCAPARRRCARRARQRSRERLPRASDRRRASWSSGRASGAASITRRCSCPADFAPGAIASVRLVASDARHSHRRPGMKGGGWLARLKSGLSRSSQRLSEGIAQIVGRRRLDQATLDQLEELLIGADLGTTLAEEFVGRLKRTRFNQEVSEAEIRAALGRGSAEIAVAGGPAARSSKRKRSRS